MCVLEQQVETIMIYASLLRQTAVELTAAQQSLIRSIILSIIT